MKISTVGGDFCVEEHQRSRHTGRELLKSLQPFAADLGLESGEARQVAARVRQALDKPAADRVADLRKDGRYRAPCLQQGRQEIVAMDDNDIRLEIDDLHRITPHAIGIGAAEAIVETNVAALNPTGVAKPPDERVDPAFGLGVVLGCSDKHADTPHLAVLLCVGGKRPSDGGAAEQRNDLAPPHSITSSARCRNNSGTVMPSTLAVLRLITSWNWVGSCTGRSPGEAPRRMRST